MTVSRSFLLTVREAEPAQQCRSRLLSQPEWLMKCPSLDGVVRLQRVDPVHAQLRATAGVALDLGGGRNSIPLRGVVRVEADGIPVRRCSHDAIFASDHEHGHDGLPRVGVLS